MTVLDTCKLNIYVSTKSLVFDLESLTSRKIEKMGKCSSLEHGRPGELTYLGNHVAYRQHIPFCMDTCNHRVDFYTRHFCQRICDFQ